MSENEKRIERNFVFTGIRVDDKAKRYVSLKLVEDDGTLTDEMWFAYKRNHAHSTGKIYNCKFSEDFKSVFNLSRPSWVGVWHDKQARLLWEAEERKAEAIFKRAKLQAEASRLSEIDETLQPLRELWSSMRERYDMAACKALEDAVLSSLRTPLRKFEQN